MDSVVDLLILGTIEKTEVWTHRWNVNDLQERLQTSGLCLYVLSETAGQFYNLIRHKDGWVLTMPRMHQHHPAPRQEVSEALPSVPVDLSKASRK